MTDPWNQSYEDPDFDDEGASSKKRNPLRERLKQLEEENKSLKQTNEKVLSQIRRQTIADTLKEAGVNPKIAALVPRDIEATEDAVKKWLADWQDVFAPQASDDDGAGDEGGTSQDPPPGQDGMQRISKATTGGAPPKGGQEETLNALRSKDLTHDQLLEMINNAGGGFGAG